MHRTCTGSLRVSLQLDRPVAVLKERSRDDVDDVQCDIEYVGFG